MKTTRLRPPTLSSTAAREALAHRSEVEFKSTIHAIEKIGSLYDAVTTLHSTPDPALTKEGRAQRYKERHEKALQLTRDLVDRVAHDLGNLTQEAVQRAEAKAGLSRHLPHAEAAELRTALRSLPEAERNGAIVDAAKRGDVDVLLAVKDASPLLTGKIGVPVQTLIREYVERAAPELPALIKDAESAATHFELALDSFMTNTRKLRDPILEARAEEQAKAVAQAEADIA